MKKCFNLIGNLFIFIFYFTFVSPTLATFQKNSSNPILNIGTVNQWDDELVSAPRVIKDNSGYKMWYSGFDGFKGKIGLATSTDGINWTRHPNNPILSPKTSDPWEIDIGEPSVYYDGINYAMWFTSFNFSQPESFRISRTTSSDGINWAEQNTVFTKSSAAWEAEGVNTPDVIFLNNEYKMWYSARDNTGKWRIGYATSLDGITWNRNTNPILEPTLLWEGKTVTAASVILVNGVFHMYYHAGPVVPHFIGHATSTDGINWTKDSDPILTRGGFTDFDRTMIASPRIIRDNNKLRLYYAGHDGAHWRIGMAEELLPVPYLAQNDPVWGNDIYDSANLWANPNAQTMSSLGCALTSATMILKHFNVQKTPGNLDANPALTSKDLNPGTLNEWLKSRNDGAFRNGSTNWAVIAKMTKMNNELDPSSPKLEYFASPSAALNEVLGNSLPAILNLEYPPSPSDAHFVVATKIDGTTYSINDPLYPARITLAPHYTTINRIGYYKPTNSDFSYIVLAVDPQVSLTLKDSQGNSVGDQFIDKPIADGVAESSAGGTPLKLLYYKTPQEDTYTIELSATTSASYQLDSYAYNTDGDGGKLNNITGIVNNTDKDVVKLTVDPESTSAATLTEEITFQTLKNDIQTAYDLGWIQKEKLYKGLLAEATAAEKLYAQNKKFTAKVILKAMVLEINYLKNKGINPDAYDLLKKDLIQLLKLP